METVIWLSEVAPRSGKTGARFFEHLANANHDANPELMRLALKLATGAGKTTVMVFDLLQGLGLLALAALHAARYFSMTGIFFSNVPDYVC